MNHLQGLILVTFGVIYLLYPFILGKGYWFKTSFAPSNLTPNESIKYMRGIAIVLISIGLIVLFLDNSGYILMMFNNMNIINFWN